jgi:hypothetical protein
MEGLDIENNSFLDYNTNSGNTIKGTLSNEAPKQERQSSASFRRMCETNENGDQIVSIDIKIPSKHPILKRKNIEVDLVE